MSGALSFTENDLFVALRGLLAQMPLTGSAMVGRVIQPAPVEIIRAQVNRVPEPRCLDFIIMTQINRNRLSTNTNTYTDGWPSLPGVAYASQSTQYDIQLDVHGPNSGDNIQVISTLFRDEYATSYFDQQAIDAQALYTSDPHQAPFVNAESQWESRWVITLSLQANIVVQVPQEFADSLVVGIIDVEVVYPP